MTYQRGLEVVVDHQTVSLRLLHSQHEDTEAQQAPVQDGLQP